MPIDASKIIWDNLEDIDVSKVVWDKTEDVSAGILTHEPKTTTELQPPITRHGLPEEAGEPISTITGKPVKPAKETLPKYQTPGYTGTWDKEYDVIGGIKDVGKLLYDVPVNTIGAVASLWEDDNPEAEYDWKDIAIKNQELRSEQRAIEEGGEKYVLPGVQRKDIREASKSAGFSAVAMGGGLLGGLAATPVPVPGARIAGALAGSGVAAYSMDKTMFTSQLIDSYRQTIQREEGRDVTPDEVAGFVEKTRGLRSKHALWEAIPESIGNVAQLSGIGGMFKAALGKKLGTKIFSTLIGMYGAEIGTETITQMGQHNVEVEAGLSPGQKRSFKSVDDYYESFKEVAPQTFVLVSLTGGAGAVGTKSYQLIANPKNTNDASEVNPVVMQFNKGEIDLPQAVDQINASDASQEAKKAATDLLKKPEPGKEKLLAKFQEAKDKRLEPRILEEGVYGSKRGLPFTNKNLANLNKNRIAKEVGVTPEDLTMIPVEDGFAWKKIVEPVELKEGRALTTKEITAERARVFEEAPRKPAEVSAEAFEREVTEEEKVRVRAEIEPDINKFMRRAEPEEKAEAKELPLSYEQVRFFEGLPRDDAMKMAEQWNKIWTTGTEAAKDARMVEAQTLIKARPDLFTLVRDIKGDVELMSPEEAEKLPAGQGFVIKPVTKLRKAPVAKPLEAEVEYKPIVTKSGKPFKTMALANASLKQRGLSQTDHTIIEHEGGYAIQRFGRKIKALEPTSAAEAIEVAREAVDVEKAVELPEYVYHGGSGIKALKKEFKVLSPEEKQKLPSSVIGLTGLSMTTEASVAKKYSQAIGQTEEIFKAKINKDAKIYHIDTKGDGIDEVFTDNEINNLITQGYDAILDKSGEKEFRALTESALIPVKPQLSKVEKPAKEAPKKPTGVEANKEAYGSQEKADAAVESIAKEAQFVSTKSVPDRVRVEESNVIKELKSKKRVDFTGRKLTPGNESQEIAELFQVYRSPKLEILHTIYTAEDGTILGHNAMTSGQIDYVAPKDMAQYVYRMKSAVKRLGAAKVHVLHNHPAGNEEMSPQDVNFAAKISKDLGVKGGEFIVIDHGKFSRVAKLEAGVGSVEYGKFKKTEGIKDWTTGKVKISSEQEMAQFGRSLAYDKNKAVFVYLGNQNEVQGWTIHDKKILTKGNIALKNSIQQQIKAHDATKAVLIADSPLLLKRIVKGQRIGNWLIDVQDIKGNSLRVEFPSSFERGGEATKQAWGLFESKAEYGKPRAKLKAPEKAELAELKALKRKLRKAEKELEKIKTSKDILQNRRYKIRAFRDYFNLTDKELREISRKDIRLMSNYEFKQFIDQMEVKAEKLNVKRQAMNELVTQIMDKELNIENLRKAMKLPTLKNMTVAQIKHLDETLAPFQKGDEFLSVRKLETVDRTELEGIKTWREAREHLAKEISKQEGRTVSVEELQKIKVSEFDRFRYDTGLAERDPFYRMMVEKPAARMLTSEAQALEMEKEVFALARKIKGKGFWGRFVPQHKNIMRWMEAPADQKAKIPLSTEEMALAKYMVEKNLVSMDYLIKVEAINMGKDNYFTHIRRGILEAVKEDGIIKAVKELFTAYKLEEQGFNILDRSTGEVLAMDKFFKFAMHRTGKLKPTQNVVKAFLAYQKTFLKKQALDEIVPLIDIYAHALTPKGLTKKGLLLHGNLIKLVKEYLNTLKGRHITLIAKQNGKIDAALRAIKMFTSMRDLAFNIPVSVATEVGEQITTYQLLGKGKFVLGQLRQNTKQGKAIVEKYRNLIGKNPWKELVEPSKEIGDRLMEGIFILFRDASTRANKTFLLGSLSKEEFKSGEISPGRLAALRTELGRYRMVEGMKSIIGATPEGKSYTQYRKWAIPILRTTIKNLNNLGKKITFQKPKSKEFKKSILELYRLVEVTAFMMLMFGMVRDEDDKSFTGKMINKAYKEATTLIQALGPSTILAIPRTAAFIEDLGINLTLILLGEKYKTTDEYKGIKKLKRQFTPVAISQLAGEKEVKLKRKPKLSERFSKRRLDRKKKLSDRWKRR